MPPGINPNTSTAEGDVADAYLYIKTKSGGVVKGESQATDYVDQIVVKGWRWGVAASSAIGHTAATGRRSYTGLTVFKTIDAATTPLMSALVRNDEVTEARLSMRRAGGDQELYFTILLNGARVSAVNHEVDRAGNAIESITLLFTKVEVEYRPQKKTGQRGGSMMFNDSLSDAD